MLVDDKLERAFVNGRHRALVDLAARLFGSFADEDVGCLLKGHVLISGIPNNAFALEIADGKRCAFGIRRMGFVPRSEIEFRTV